MSNSGIHLVLFEILCALAIFWAILQRIGDDATPEMRRAEKLHTRVYAPPGTSNCMWLLPLALVSFPIAALWISGDPRYAVRFLLTSCFPLFLQIMIYYAVLLPLLPVLRRFLSATTCASLWYVPACLYYALNAVWRRERPIWVFRVPVTQTAMTVAVCLWLAGFAGILAWKLMAHLVFRRRILRRAKPVEAAAVRDILTREVLNARIEIRNIPLMTSPDVKTPLSIGLFKRTTVVVLPEQAYTPEELTLIFRHEIIHISRRDSVSKLFLTFCTAMCWFNPLMWIAMRRSADDLELGCDEAVLLNRDDTVRRRYADLLLRTAGDERGFTTCLSASAKALRYRLKNVVRPRKRITGAILTGILSLAMLASCGTVAMAYDAAPAEEHIFGGVDPAVCTVSSVNWWDTDGPRNGTTYNEAALTAYLASLEPVQLAGDYDFSREVCLQMRYTCPKGDFTLVVTPDFLEVRNFFNGSAYGVYYIGDQLDWNYLCSLLTGGSG